MNELKAVLERAVDEGRVPGAVVLVDRGGEVQVEVAGEARRGSGVPMTDRSLFRVASITKPLTAAAVMCLVDDGVLGLGDEVRRWLPELAEPRVVVRPDAPVEQTVPAARPITVEDLLTFRAGWGFPADFSLPAVGLLMERLQRFVMDPDAAPDVDTWTSILATVPMLSQPGETWLYNTCSDVQGVLVARACGRPFDEFLTERILAPLGMTDTGFHVPAGSRDRLTTAYRPDRSEPAQLQEVGPPTDRAVPPPFPSGAGGLVCTAPDWHSFGRMLLAGGLAPDLPGVPSPGARVLSPESVRAMTTDHLTADQRAASELFLDGQGWGFGGSVDVAPDPQRPWVVPGRYGWVGGTGTSAHVVPSSSQVVVLMTQVEMTSPVAPPLMREVWTAAAGGGGA